MIESHESTTAKLCSFARAYHSTYTRKKIFDDALETRASGEAAEIDAGDQGIMFGYATNETEELMPLTAVLTHKLARRLTEVRENGTLSYLRPDGKTQVSVRYEDGHPVSVDTVLVSAQHDPEVTREQLHRDIRREVIVPVLQDFLNEDTRILINPTGRFVIGGPVGTAVLQDERSLSIPMAARPSTAAVPSPERIHKGRPLRRLCRKICGKKYRRCRIGGKGRNSGGICDRRGRACFALYQHLLHGHCPRWARYRRRQRTGRSPSRHNHSAPAAPAPHLCRNGRIRTLRKRGH